MPQRASVRFRALSLALARVLFAYTALISLLSIPRLTFDVHDSHILTRAPLPHPSSSIAPAVSQRADRSLLQVTVNAIVLYWVTEPPSASGVGPDTVPRLKTIEDDEQKGPVVTLPAAARRPRPYPHTPSLPSSGWDSELDTAHTASTESMRFAPPPSGRAPPFSSTARLVISIPQLRAPDPVSSPASQSSASPASFTLKRTRSGGLVRAPPSPAAVHRPAAGGRTFSWSPGALSPAPERHFPRAAPAPLTESKWSRALWFGPSAPPRRPRPVRLAALASLPESYPLHRHSLTLPRDPDPDPQLARTHSLPLA